MFFKFNLSTKILILNLFFYIVKIPLSLNAFKSVRNEIKIYRQLETQKIFFSKNFGILSIYPFFLSFFIIKRGNQIHQNDKIFLKQYIEYFNDYRIEKKASDVLDLKY